MIPLSLSLSLSLFQLLFNPGVTWSGAAEGGGHVSLLLFVPHFHSVALVHQLALYSPDVAYIAYLAYDIAYSPL